MHISSTIYENFRAISDFFSSKNYELMVEDLEKFIMGKYPKLFKRNLRDQ